MILFAICCGFAGAWLLVAGPIYQAAIELRKDQISQDRLAAAGSTVPRPPAVSAWWWLLPPVRLILDNQRRNRYQQAVLVSLSPDDLDTMLGFISNATGWLFVATGGLLIAMRETFELVEHLELAPIFYWLTVVVMFTLCALNAAYRIAGSDRLRAGTQPGAPAGGVTHASASQRHE